MHHPGQNWAGPCPYSPSQPYPVHIFLWHSHFTVNPKTLLRYNLGIETTTYMAHINGQLTINDYDGVGTSWEHTLNLLKYFWNCDWRQSYSTTLTDWRCWKLTSDCGYHNNQVVSLISASFLTVGMYQKTKQKDTGKFYRKATVFYDQTALNTPNQLTLEAS